MTVVGLQKNTIDTLSTISGGSNGVNNVANSGAKDFLQILTLLADQSISDVDGVEETSLLHLPTNLKLNGDKPLKISSQLHIGQDKLEDTIDYVQVIGIVKKQMKKTKNMIESVADKILDELFKIDLIQSVNIELEKISPPVDADFDKISIEIFRTKQ